MDNSTDLNISVDYLEQTQNTSSLEDVYGYRVFDSKFKEKINSTREKERKEIEKSCKSVFIKKENNDIKDAYNKVMNTKASTVIKNDYDNNSGNGLSFKSEISFVLVGMLVAGIILYFVDKGIRRKNANKNNNKI